MAIGKDAALVRKHRADGTVSSNKKNNHFISAGPIKNVYCDALDEVYPGGFCEGALCSYRKGMERFWLCICGGKRNHDLPACTGPNDKDNWRLVMQKSNEARRIALANLDKKRKRK